MNNESSPLWVCLLSLAAVAAILFGLNWLLWKGWCYAMPAMFGPSTWTQPTWGVFAVFLIVVTAILGAVRGNNKK